jgi:hypothetical protein
MAVGVIFDLFSLQFKRRERLVLTLAIACFLTSWHFFLLEQHTAGYMFGLAAIRHLISLKWRSWKVGALFVTLSIIGTILSYVSYLSIMGCLANILMTLGSFAKKDKTFRLLLMSGSFVWLIHNIVVFTPLGILLEVLFLISGFISLYRFSLSLKLKT